MGSIPDRIPPGRIVLTYDDYVELPDDGNRYEILDGELHVTPPPATRHQIASINLATILHVFVRKNRIGQVLEAPTGVILAETTIVEPDILFVRAARQSIITERAVEGPPDLVVEILSPGTSRRDRTTKAAVYARYGVPHYWLLDPDSRTLELYENDGESYRLVRKEEGDRAVRSSLFPGLEISLGEVWD
jgi:Uma2 family endonuclease